MYGGETQVPGVTVNFPGYSGGDAVNVSGNGTIDADFVDVSGGVNKRNAFTAAALDGGDRQRAREPPGQPAHAHRQQWRDAHLLGPKFQRHVCPRGLLERDHLDDQHSQKRLLHRHLYEQLDGANAAGRHRRGNSTATIPPGIYGSISLSGNSDITFGWDQPSLPPVSPRAGDQYLRPHRRNDVGFDHFRQLTITGSNMMFYNTGTKYNPLTGDNGSTQFGSTISPAIPASFIPRPPRALREHLVLPEPAEHFSHELLWQ